MVTIKDIAKAAGVTFATVSRALNNEPGVNPLTRQKILDISKEMNYIPNLAAKRLSDRSSKTIGFIWPKMKGWFFWHLCHELHTEANKRGFSVLASFDEPDQALRLLNAHFVDRMLFWTSADWVPSSEFYKAREVLRSKMLLIGGGSLDGTHHIMIDRKGAIFKAVEHLAGLGHRRVVFLGAQTEKLVGFTLGLLEFQLEYHPDTIIACEDDDQLPEEKLVALLSRPASDRPTAIIADRQGILFPLLRVIRKLNLKIPEDISLVVYDSVPEMEQLFETPLTTVGPDIHDLAMKSLDILTDDVLLKDDATAIQMTLESNINVRESTRRIE